MPPRGVGNAADPLPARAQPQPRQNDADPMTVAIDTSSLSVPAQKILSGPPKLQEMAAKGVAIGVPPGDLIVVLAALTQSAEPGVADTARRTLDNLPAQVLSGALGANLQAAAIHEIATRNHDRIDVLGRLIAMPAIDIDTLLEVGKVCSEDASELLATNEERLLSNPKLIEVLYLNKRTRMSTADRMIELAVRNNVEVGLPAWKEAAAAIQNELIPEPTGELSPDDVLFAQNLALAEAMRAQGEEIEDTHELVGDEEEKVKDKYVPLFREIAMMTTTQKIRLASVGTPEAIMILISDASPLVASAAAKSPNINEAVVEQVAKRRNIMADVLTSIGQRPELLRRLSTKRDLMKNPKTPPSLALKLINHFQAHELERMAGDRNVGGATRQLIKNHLERKKR
ncbi:MAG: hypothetical protein IPM79_25130 [Polyangiaceae bacterium]|jgi:hypothetical protein|nr:hypothetical protein [Polyangiaceae bacterium]